MQQPAVVAGDDQAVRGGDKRGDVGVDFSRRAVSAPSLLRE